MDRQMKDKRLKYHRTFIDLFPEEDMFMCQCGKRFYADCGVSRASINEAFDRHQQEAIDMFEGRQTTSGILV